MGFVQRLATSVAFAVCVIVLLGVSYVVVEAACSNGNVDYCYVEMYSPVSLAPQYRLSGHRPWRADRVMGAFPTLEEAKAKADVIGCKLNGD
jgi:hypothetical protein